MTETGKTEWEECFILRGKFKIKRWQQTGLQNKHSSSSTWSTSQTEDVLLTLVLSQEDGLGMVNYVHTCKRLRVPAFRDSFHNMHRMKLQV